MSTLKGHYPWVFISAGNATPTTEPAVHVFVIWQSHLVKCEHNLPGHLQEVRGGGWGHART